MKHEIHLHINIEVYDTPEDLPLEERTLLQRAKAALPNAYAPYSGFYVSAAILLENNKILVGTNHENAAYPMCLCAERVVLAAAHAQFPNILIKTMAITNQNTRSLLLPGLGGEGNPISPCGACRQVICETEHRYKSSIQIILQGETGVIYKLASGRDLLPLAFNRDFL